MRDKDSTAELLLLMLMSLSIFTQAIMASRTSRFQIRNPFERESLQVISFECVSGNWNVVQNDFVEHGSKQQFHKS